jgi:hypothetical protein
MCPRETRVSSDLNHTATSGVRDASKRFSGVPRNAQHRMDRKTQFQIGLSIAVVLAFIGVLAVLSTSFSTNGGMTETGGYALVAALIGFVFVLSGTGLWISRRFGDGDAS